MLVALRVLITMFMVTGMLSVAQAELRIEISQGVEKAVPIAVVPFGWDGRGGTAPFDVAALIAADLERSGRFAPIEPEKMLQRPTSGRDVDFEDWRMVGIEVVVVGSLIETARDDFTIQIQLFDVFRGELLLGYRQPARLDHLRRESHRVADMIYEELTGIRGIFSTQIAYVTANGDARNRTFRLIVADADGANARVLVESPEPIMSPAWSPDSRKLAYVSFERQQSQIYV